MACVACKRRKVRCSGGARCKECLQANLTCIFPTPDSSARSRKKIRRGGVIEGCKRDFSETRPTGLSSSPLSPIAQQHLLNRVLESVDYAYYSQYIYPFVPIFSESEFRCAAANANSSNHDAALAYVLAALTINAQPNIASDQVKRIGEVDQLYEKALELRGVVMPHHYLTVRSVMISLVAAMMSCERRPDISFYYLREAITTAMILRVDDEGSNAAFNEEEQSRRQRLHWVLFVHERYFSIVQYRPAILKELPGLPLSHSSVPAYVQGGFCQIIRLFRSIDTEFVRIWLDKQNDSITVDWVKEKYAEIVGSFEGEEESLRQLSHTQKIDLIVTRHWLCVLLWEKALSRFLLTADDGSNQSVLSIDFPTSLSRSLRQSLATFARHDVDIHGNAMMRKIFEISVALADIVLLVFTNERKFMYETIDDFHFMQEYLSSNPRFDDAARAVLESKTQSLRSIFSL